MTLRAPESVDPTFSTVDVLNQEVVKGDGRLNGAQDLTMTTRQQQNIREQ